MHRLLCAMTALMIMTLGCDDGTTTVDDDASDAVLPEDAATSADGTISGSNDGSEIATMPDVLPDEHIPDMGDAHTQEVGPPADAGPEAAPPDGQTDACAPSTDPEICNGLDDDCDGEIDEGDLTETCYTGPENTLDVGDCHAGTRTCQGGIWSDCEGQVLPADVEICRGGGDEDCNGLANGCDVDQCNNPPGEEACNGVDDNCNGIIDEGCPPEG